MQAVIARRLTFAGMLTGILAGLALLAPGARAMVGIQCSGVAIAGQGSTAGGPAELAWSAAFNSSANKSACSGKQGSGGKPPVAFTATDSIAAMESWSTGARFGVGNAFVATDIAPNDTVAPKVSEIEAHAPVGIAVGKVLTIPVSQSALAIVVHLPTNCIANSTAAPGRLVLKQASLEEVYAGAITTWAALLAANPGTGDVLSPASPAAGCTAGGAITRVVREDVSGSTSALQRFLYEVDHTFLCGGRSWVAQAEALTSTWCGPPVTVEKGPTHLLTEIASTPGTIGYANLAYARENASFVPPAGGAGTATFWVELQNNKRKLSFADPSTDGDSSVAEQSNCAKEKYYEELEPTAPPASAADIWSKVSAGRTQKHYPLCYLSYVLSLTRFSAFEKTTEVTTEPEATTVANYLGFVVNKATGGGQKLLSTAVLDLQALPGNVLKSAEAGAGEVGF